MRDLGIEFISVFGLPPADFVHLAADLGCSYISTALTMRPLKSLGYQAFSLKDDRALRREFVAAMDERGVGMFGLAADLDVMAQLGAAQINTLSFDRDRDRTFDQLATLTELAEFLAAVSADVVVGLEIPTRSLAEAGVGPMDRLRPCVAATRQLGCR